MGLCGLRCTLAEDEVLKYVLCSSYFGNCGRLKHYVYFLETKELECWGKLIRQEKGVKAQFCCDTTIPFDLETVLQCYLKDRASCTSNPVFDPERYDARYVQVKILLYIFSNHTCFRYGVGKSKNYVVPKIVFGDLDNDHPPIPSVSTSETRLTRSAVAMHTAKLR